MKKIALLSAICTIIPFASANAMEKNQFVSLNVLPSSIFQFSDNAKDNRLEIGGSVEYGRVINEWFKTSIELGAKTSEFLFIEPDDELYFDNYTAMVNGYFYTTLANQYQPYVGIGLGTSLNDLSGDVNLDSNFDFTYAIKVGMNVIVNDYLDLNMGVKYQDYGAVEAGAHKAYFKSTDVFFGASYKF